MDTRLRTTGFVVAIAIVAAAPVGCTLLSGVGDLNVVANSALDGTAPPPLGEGGSGVDGNIPATDSGVDAPANPPDSAPMTDGGTEAAPVCAQPNKVDGSFTPCKPSANVPANIGSCVEYCQSLGKCCAENCTPFSSDPTTREAEYTDVDNAHCSDPLLGGGISMGFSSCSNSPVGGGTTWFKCCCGK